MTTVTDLSQVLNSWIRRLRLRRAFIWALHGLNIGLALALILGTIGLYRAQLLRPEFLTLVSATPLLGACVAALVAFLWPIRNLEAARYFDRHFQLKERVSTALEFGQDSGMNPSEMMDRQLQDAVAASRQVNLRRALPFRYSLREGAVVLLLIALIGAVWSRGERWFLAGQQSRAVEQAVAEQSAQIEEIVKQIEANEALSEAQKKALTAPLNEALQKLQENPALENSVSVLTSTSEKMQTMSDPQSQQAAQALKETGNQLANQDGSPLQGVGQELAQGDYVSAASQLQNLDVNKLSPAEQQQLADQLDAMANSLQSTNPGLANQLQQAASALRNGDTASAQQALKNAAQSLAQTGQQVTSSQIASQTASQMQQGAGQVLAAGGSGQQQANQAGQGGQPGNQPGQGNQSGQGNQQGQSGSNQGQANGAGGAGAGKGSGTGDNPTGNEAGSSPIQGNNGPGDGGEATYEQIYAPTLLGGEGGPQVDLPGPDNSGEVVGQGPVTPGDPGTSLVPYSEVYSQYEQINNQTIENGEIPAQFTQIIKNYFDSLKP